MSYLDLLKLKLNEHLKIKVDFLLEDKSFFKNIFYAYLREVNEEYIIVEEYYVKVDEDFNEKLTSQKRKLKIGDFEILKEK